MRTAKSISVLALLMFAMVQVCVGCEEGSCGLVIRGNVTSLGIDRSDKSTVRFFVQLGMEFKNEGSKPIILFNPNTDNSYLEDRYYLGGKSLSLTDGGEPIFGYGAWESVMGTDFYRQLANKLDAKKPPKEYTMILQPNEVWAFADKTEIVFSAEEERSSYPTRKSWKEMQRFSPQLWLTVHYELSPWNIEYFKPNLIRKLQKRWRNYGEILVEKEKDGRFNHFLISSRPMKIDFSQAK